MNKTKHLYSITIDGTTISTRLSYNLNTNHIGIGNLFNYQNKYYENNKEQKKKYQKEYYQNNKEQIIKHNKQYQHEHSSYKNMIHSQRGSDEHRIRLSCGQQGIDRNNWNGFAINSPYCYKFNDECREKNRNKYNYKCFICDKNESNNGKKLSVHHIDMSKSQGCNGEKWKLVPVCSQCHNKLHTKLWEYRIKYLLNN